MKEENTTTVKEISTPEEVERNLYEKNVISRFKAAIAKGDCAEVDNLIFSMEVLIQDKPFRSIRPDILTAMMQGRIMTEAKGKETFWFIVNGLLAVYKHVEQ